MLRLSWEVINSRNSNYYTGEKDVYGACCYV